MVTTNAGQGMALANRPFELKKLNLINSTVTEFLPYWGDYAIWVLVNPRDAKV